MDMKFKDGSSTDINEVLEILKIKNNNASYSTGQKWGKFKTETSRKILSPINGIEIASVEMANTAEYEKVVTLSQSAFEEWRTVPAPKRGEIVRQIGDKLRKYKSTLGALVT